MAIKFGLAFTVILLVARAAQIYFGEAGVYVSSALSGLVGVDAIVLSLAELSRDAGGIDPAVAGRGIILAAVANTVAKGGIVLVAGTGRLRRVVIPGFLLMILVAILLMVFLV